MRGEHHIQNAIRNALARVDGLRIFRVNVGTAIAGSPGPRWRENGVERVTIVNPRPFSSGLPPGTPDLLGFIPVVVTPEMVGQTVAVVVGVEVKADSGRVSEAQTRALAMLRECGARVGVARTEAEALAIVAGEP